MKNGQCGSHFLNNCFSHHRATDGNWFRMKKLIPLVLMLMTAVSCVFSGPSHTPKVVTAPEPAQPNGYSSDEQSSTQVNTFPTKIPVVNVYLETSGSMNGYVNNGQSQFQQVVYD